MKTIPSKEKVEVVLHPEISQWRKIRGHEALGKDLEKTGQLQNIIFRRLADGKLQLLAGYSRYHELSKRGVPFEKWDMKILEKVSEKDALFIAMSENRFRRKFSPIEEGRMFRSMQKIKMLIEEIAARYRCSESYVRNRLDLLDLPFPIQERMEKREIPMSYARSILRLEKVGKEAQLSLAKEIVEGQKKYYGGIRSVEEAEEYVEKTLARVDFVKKLVAKYGPCPSCGSTNIEQNWNEDRLMCKRCGHSWHRKTKEPWQYYELKKTAKKLGLKLDIGEGKAKLKPADVTEIMKTIKEEVEKEKPPAKTLRSTYTISKLLAPFIRPENLHLFRLDGDKIEVRLIQDSRLHFTARRHNYKTGEKSQIRPRGAWNEDYRETAKRVEKFLKSLELD